MASRLNLYSSSPKAMEELMSFHEFAGMSALEETLLALVRVYVALLEGCQCSIDLHARRARTLGEPDERIWRLSGWRAAGLYSARERAALAWAECVTRARSDITDDEFDAARVCFTEEELGDLTVVIVATGAWTRVQVSFR